MLLAIGSWWKNLNVLKMHVGFTAVIALLEHW